MKFIISESDGLLFSLKSGDHNKLHLDDLVGYNSIFGEKICHGSLVLSKVFKFIKLKNTINKKKKYSLKINFLKHFRYNLAIYIKRINNKIFVFQEKVLKCEIIFDNNNYIKFNNFKKKDLYNSKSILPNQITIEHILKKLSEFVGTVYPGNYSVIKGINFNFNKNYKFKNKIIIFSKKIDPRLDIISNQLKCKNYLVEFTSFKAPYYELKNIKPKKNLINLVKKLKTNTLIIGASQGIGRRLLDLFNYNKKIYKIATYNKNILNIKDKKVICKKIDINKDLIKLKKIIKKYKPLNIYYFSTPKITFDKKISKEKYKNFRKFFIDVPLEILKCIDNKNFKLFYPSTILVNVKNSSTYSMIKYNAERSLKKISKKKGIKIKIFRFPAINSKQSISLIDKTPIDFIEYLNKNRFSINKIIFND